MMFQFDSKTLGLIQKTCKGKKHIKLSVGFTIGDDKIIKVYDESGETDFENYIYQIGSITKTFTASLLSKYIYEQKMSLDDSIQKYIEDLDTTRYYPTLQWLATHTAGYSERLPLNRREYLKLFSDMVLGRNQGVIPFHIDLGKIKTLVKNIELQDKDYQWEYSNFGYALLGYAIGVVSGKEYRDTIWDLGGGCEKRTIISYCMKGERVVLALF